MRGALNYNENKVNEGKAELLAASGYHKEGDQLSFSEKFLRLQHQADLNERVQHRCVHISLNFDPSEKDFSPEKLSAIASAYMEKMGFGDQPYLLYKHTDAAHPHVHIVTTSIRSDGSPIRLHNIGEVLSEQVRPQIEQEFGLIPAESHRQKEIYQLKPVDLRQVLYGKSETKAAISNTVRSVVANYKFSSLAQLNAVLQQYNVTADPGEKGTRMHEKGGLIYSLIDGKGNKVGIPIKSSSIYSKPTLKYLEGKFDAKNSAKEKYKQRVRMLVDDAIQAGVVGKDGLKDYLKQQGIHVAFRENEEGKVYGLTYVDNKTFSVFNGSDLGKSYSAKGVLERLAGGLSTDLNAVKKNRDFVNQVSGSTNYAPGFKPVLARWAMQGLLVDAKISASGEMLYGMGQLHTGRENYMPIGKKLSTYLQVNGYSQRSADLMHEGLQDELSHGAEQLVSLSLDAITRIVNAALQPAHEGDYVDYHWLKNTERKRKRRRR